MGTNETFYAALGVDADADADRIESAYRERVKHTHPDVSDDDDAVEAFKRLTEARDVLVDETARERYDRVGHATYVRQYLDSTVWSITTGSGHRTDRSPSGRGGPTGAASGRDTGDTGAGADTGSHGRTAGNYDRYKASGAATDDDSWRAREDRHGTGRGTHVGEGPFSGTDDSWAGGTSSEGNSPDGGGMGHTTGEPGQRTARTDGWQRAHTATGTYSPSGQEASGATARASPAPSSVRAGLAAVGPWLVFHVVFLVSALVTAWLLLTLSPTVPTALFSIALFGGALLASSLHVVTRLYS